MFSSEDFGFGEMRGKISTKCEESLISMEKFDFENQFSATDFGYFQDEFLAAEQEYSFSKYQLQQDQQQQLISADELLDDHRYNLVSPPLEACLAEIKRLDEAPTSIQNDVEVVKKKEVSFSLASLGLLYRHGSGFKRLRGDRIVEPNTKDKSMSNDQVAKDHQKQSTEEILRIAGMRFIHSSSQQAMVSHPFQWSFSVLLPEETKNVELVELLLASAEKVGFRNFESARRLLNLCDNYFSSGARDPVQRVVYYFREALREKIDRETGRIASKSSSRGRNHERFDLDKAMTVPDMTKIAFHRVLPFSQVEKFAGIQAIVERIGDSRKVHVIDLRIMNGVQWTVLMQALASRRDYPLELLKITTIGSADSGNFIEETGKRLSNFASTMNIPFSFKKVMVSQMLDLKEDLFEFDTDELVAVYSSFGLSSMISQPTQIEALMRVIRGLNPCIMVVAEVEANHNSPSFVKRFTEALFFYGAFFDLVETLMERDQANRSIVESMYTFEAIRSIVADEGEERKVRHVKIDVWRAFFQRFGMEEIEFSQSSIYQANLVINRFECGNFCTLDVIGKSLFLSWKGTPLQSISIWKFL
uniref:DELLA RGL1-like protein n=1 Tax=Boehmeria nivea TaxID=83906 RepID=A0A5J6WE88_BOENI|nr:DELLA RGL1-like protein [Boehmeria nivea]